VFDRHCVPFVTTARRPLIHEPLCKLVLQLAALPTNDFYCAPVLDVITSPLYRSSVDSVGSAHHHPDQWRILVAALHITHGREEWDRLRQMSRSDRELDGTTDDLAEGLSVRVAPKVIARCWQVVADLLNECAGLPERGTVGQLCDAFRQLLIRHVHRPDAEAGEDEDARTKRLRAT
jgi:ATP-dependent helicase/nuclease subunit B